MKIIECLHTDSKCYKAAEYCSPVGIVVHSTGANNPNMKRYVQPSKSDPNYDELIAVIGLNKNGNSWNRSVNKAVHYFIGKLADGSVGTAHVLPETNCAWGVGKGKKGSYNYNPNAHIQFEICEDNLKDESYFNKVMKEAQELCAYLCKEFDLTELHVCSHAEAYKRGYGSNHGDIDHWLKKYGKDMNWFRDEVKKLRKGEEPVVTFKSYKVKVTTSDLNVRKGPGTNYGKNGCIRDKGVYTIVDEAEGATKWLKLKSGAGWISADYVEKI